MEKDTKDKQTAVRLEIGEYRKLERIARSLDRSISWCIRAAIQAYIEANRPQQSAK